MQEHKVNVSDISMWKQTPKRECGDCTACCILLPIEDTSLKILPSAAGVACVHCDIGCNIYKDRPEICRTYQCEYTLSEDMPEELRPDNSHVIFEKITTKVYLALVDTQHPGALNSKPVEDYINQLNAQGISVIASAFNASGPIVKAAPQHDPEVVYKIAMEAASRGRA